MRCSLERDGQYVPCSACPAPTRNRPRPRRFEGTSHQRLSRTSCSPLLQSQAACTQRVTGPSYSAVKNLTAKPARQGSASTRQEHRRRGFLSAGLSHLPIASAKKAGCFGLKIRTPGVSVPAPLEEGDSSLSRLVVAPGRVRSLASRPGPRERTEGRALLQQAVNCGTGFRTPAAKTGAQGALFVPCIHRHTLAGVILGDYSPNNVARAATFSVGVGLVRTGREKDPYRGQYRMLQLAAK